MEQSKKYIKATKDLEKLINNTELNQYDNLFKPVLLHFMYQREIKQDMITAKKLRQQLIMMMQQADFGRYYRPSKQIDGSSCFEIILTFSGNKETF